MVDGEDARLVIAVDPGTQKCGVALLQGPDEIIRREIAARGDAFERVMQLRREYPDAAVVIGGSTQGPKFLQELAQKAGIEAELIDETFSTMDARELFWRENRPGCLWGIFPASFRPLPRPIDDYAAVIIGRRFLASAEKK